MTDRGLRGTMPAMADTISGYSHFGVRVHELARSRAFYEKLGFVFTAGPIGSEPVAIMDHPSGVQVNFIINAAEGADTNVLMDVETKHPGYTHVALAVSDVEAMQAHLQAQGIELSGGPVRLGDGLSIFVRDPDRNVLEFHQHS